MNHSRTIIRNAKRHEEAIRKMVAERLTMEQMGVEIGASRQSILRYMEVLGIERQAESTGTKPNSTSERDLLILEDRKSGMTLQGIGEKHHLTRERVRQILARNFPDFVLPPRIGVEHAPAVCQNPSCGKEFPYRFNTKYCSKSCWTQMVTSQKFTRDNAVEVMKLRDEGKTWEAIADIMEIHNLRSSIQRHTRHFFSTEEQHRYLPKRS